MNISEIEKKFREGLNIYPDFDGDFVVRIDEAVKELNDILEEVIEELRPGTYNIFNEVRTNHFEYQAEYNAKAKKLLEKG